MNKKKMSELISRSFDFKISDKEEGVLEGTPIVFEQKTDIGGMFEEVISRGAVTEQVLRDVAFFVNHDLNGKRLASTRNKTLELKVSEHGVDMRTKLNLERTDAKDLYLAVRDGEIDGMSFMFRVEEDEWTNLESDYPTRRINKIGYVQEVSAVNFPAYEGTEIYARANNPLDSELQALDSARAELKALDNAKKQKREKEIEILKIRLRKEN